jgi:Four helix bundle sensory module for signal transduction
MKGSFLKPILRDRVAAARLAIVLVVMTATILAGKLWEDVYVENLRDDCGSLFEDRLIPATTLFHLNDQVHLKRQTFEEFLNGHLNESEQKIEYLLGQHDAKIVSAMQEIEKTYLVDEESHLLSQLRATFADYTRRESQLLKQRRDGQMVTYGPEMREAFALVRAELLGLIKIQEDVGQELNRESIASATHVISLLHVQLGVTFILGLIASALAMNLTPTRASARVKNESDLH